MCVTVVMFALVIALNPKLTIVDEAIPVNPIQTVNTDISQNTSDIANTPDETISPENTDQTDLVSPEPDVAPRPRFFVHFGYPTSAEDFLRDRVREFVRPEYGIALLNDDTSTTKNIFHPKYDVTLLNDDTATKSDSTASNYYALYDEYDWTGEDYQVIGHSFVLSNDSSYIDQFTRTASVVPHVRAGQRPYLPMSPTPNECNADTIVETSASNGNSTLSISPVSAPDECDDDTAVETSATSQTLTPRYQITTIKKYPHASQIMHIVTIVASLLTSAFIGYLIYRMLKA